MLSFYKKKKNAEMGGGSVLTKPEDYYLKGSNFSSMYQQKQPTSSQYGSSYSSPYSSSSQPKQSSYSPTFTPMGTGAISGSQQQLPSLNFSNLNKATTQNKGVQQYPGPIGPQPKPQPDNSAPKSDPYTDYLAKLRALRDSTEQRGTERTQDYINSLRGIQERDESRQRSLIPFYQDQFGMFKDNVYSQIANQERSGKESEQRTRRVSGEAMRRAAQTNRENQAGLQNLFAGLGTVDSTAFQNQASKQTNEFTSEQNARLDEQATQINQIWDGVDQFKREAEMLIMQEEVNLRNRLAEIESTIDKNSFAYDQAIKDALDQARANVEAIDQQIAGIEYEAAQKQYEIEQSGGNQLMFDDSGQPANQFTKEWVYNNPDKYKEAFGAGGNAQQNEQSGVALSLIDQISNSDRLNAVLGPIQSRLPAINQGSVDLISNINQVKNILNLAAAGQLKGQGPISEGERALLEKAASGLDRAKSPEEFQFALNEAKRLLETSLYGQAVTPMARQTSELRKVQVISPDGEVGTINESELEEAIANGWRRA